MNFSLPRVFVVPVGNVLPTSGTTATLADNQFGIFLPSYAPATAGNAAAAEYLFLAQGRPDESMNLKTIKSDKIYATKVKKKVKVTGEDTARLQISSLTDITAHCGETISVTIRLNSKYIDRIFSGNGLTRTYTLSTPCCDCDGDPCEEIAAADLQALVDEAVLKINQDPIVSKYASAFRTGTGATSGLSVSGRAITEDGQSCDITVNGYEYDAVFFRMWMYKGADTMMDYVDFFNTCEQVATYTVVQTATYPRNTAAQVRLVEQREASYTKPAFKERFADPNFNALYHTNVVDGTIYTQYLIQFDNPESPNTWSQAVNQDSTVIIFAPTAQAAGIEAILEAKFGAFSDTQSGPDISTTSTSSTTSTTTTGG